METVQSRTAAPSARSVALPAQHGAWSFVLEPVLLGLLIAPSVAGLLLGVAALALFLLDQPLRVVVKDRRKGKLFARTKLAERFALLYAAVSVLAFSGAVMLAARPFWPVLVAALPLALVQLTLDLRNQARSAAAEICGAMAFAATAPAIALMAGWDTSLVLGVWAALALRALSAILYVRARLKLEKGKPVNLAPALVSQLALVVGLAALAAAAWVPWPALAGGAVLAARGLWGLSHWRKPVTAVRIGAGEVVYGLVFVGMLAVGYWI